jgi:hypothetical protein
MGQIKKRFVRWLNSEGSPYLLLFGIAVGVASFGIFLSVLAVPF